MEKNHDIFFYDVKTGETLFDYTLEDFIRDNYDKTDDYDKIYDNVLMNDLSDYEISSTQEFPESDGILRSFRPPYSAEQALQNPDVNINDQNNTILHLNMMDSPKIKENTEKLIIHCEDSKITKKNLIQENECNNFSSIELIYLPNKETIETQMIQENLDNTGIIVPNVDHDCIYIESKNIDDNTTDHENACTHVELENLDNNKLVPFKLTKDLQKVNGKIKDNMIIVKKYTKYENKIIYSNNILLNFKNNYNNILNIIPLNDKEIEILKQIFLFKNRNIINHVKIYYENGSISRGEIT